MAADRGRGMARVARRTGGRPGAGRCVDRAGHPGRRTGFHCPRRGPGAPGRWLGGRHGPRSPTPRSGADRGPGPSGIGRSMGPPASAGSAPAGAPRRRAAGLALGLAARLRPTGRRHRARLRPEAAWVPCRPWGLAGTPRRLVVGARSISHVRPRRSGASAARRVCPRRSPRARRARRAVGRMPRSRERRAPRRARRAARRPPVRGPRLSSGRIASTRSRSRRVASARPASAVDSERRSSRRFRSRTRSKTTASAAEMFRSSSSAAPNASRAASSASGSVASSGPSSVYAPSAATAASSRSSAAPAAASDSSE